MIFQGMDGNYFLGDGCLGIKNRCFLGKVTNLGNFDTF